MIEQGKRNGIPATESAEAMAIAVAHRIWEQSGIVQGKDVRERAELIGEMAGFILRRMREQMSTASSSHSSHSFRT